MPAATRSRHAAGGCASVLPRGPVAGGHRDAHGHQPVERLPDAHRGAEAGHRRDPDQRPCRSGQRARGRADRQRSGCGRCGSRTPGSCAGAPDGGPGRHPGRPAAAGQPQGLDDGGAVLGARAPVDGLRDHRRPGAPPAHAGPAGRRPLVDQQRDQRPGAGPRARRTPRRRTTASCTLRPRWSPHGRATRCSPSRRSPSARDGRPRRPRRSSGSARPPTARRPRSSTRST